MQRLSGRRVVLEPSEVGDVADAGETQCPGAQIQPGQVIQMDMLSDYPLIHVFFLGALRQQPSTPWLLLVSWAYFDDAPAVKSTEFEPSHLRKDQANGSLR